MLSTITQLTMETTFGQRIAAARGMAGLSMDELASLSGLSKFH